ncbi:MAG: hypothetical protein PUB54_07775, partial [Lachnospiraceae bacterium]|nr:hypothetical protein [Lachnospiraceae bacterium]
KTTLIPKRKGKAWAQSKKNIAYTQEERECVGTEKKKPHSYPSGKGMRGHRARKPSSIPKQMEKRGHREGKPSLIPKRKGNAWAQSKKTIAYTQEKRECVGIEQENHRLYPSKWGMCGHRARKTSPIPKRKGNAWAQRRKNIIHTQSERIESESHQSAPKTKRIESKRIQTKRLQNKKNRIKMTPNKKNPISKPHRFIIFVDFLNISLSIFEKKLDI